RARAGVERRSTRFDRSSSDMLATRVPAASRTKTTGCRGDVRCDVGRLRHAGVPAGSHGRAQRTCRVPAVISEVAAATSPALRRAIVPLALGVGIVVVPAPHGLTPSAWHFFALFVATIAALVTEPIPSPVIGLLGVTIAALLGLVAPDPAGSIRWALTGFADSTVWLMFVVLMLALGYQKTGLGHRIALTL